MTHTIPDTTFAFISYAHQDAMIAEEIERQLTVLAGKGKGKYLLKCFLDTKSIPQGQRFQPIIKSALEQADWLIAVFTDHQSVYCGYEIGIYSVVKPHDDTPLDKKPVVCLHDVDQSKIPGVVEGYNTTLVSQVAPDDPDDPIPSGEEVNLWFESPVGKFLRAFCSSKNLYTANDSPSEFTVDIAKAAKKICYSFTVARQEDEESETPVQAGLEVTIYPPIGVELKRIPEGSILVGSSRAFDILGLNLPLSLAGGLAPQVTWGQLRQALLRPERANIPWMDKLEINIALAAALKTSEPDDVTFRGSRDGRIYRAILTRHKLYKNGKRRFYVLLVETFDRRFVGDPQTSLLLIALTLASRWRFTFFERWHETLMKFDSERSDKEFQDACTQLEHNMDWIENEGVELGADDMDAMVEAFGFDNKARVQRFYSDWYAAKKKLDSQLPETFEGLKPETRAQVQAAIVDFLTSIKAQNAEFLELCMKTYGEKVQAIPT
jgi:TIR domain-containing protein